MESPQQSQEEWDKQLRRALRDGRLLEVEDLLRAGARANAVMEDGGTMLHLAAALHLPSAHRCVALLLRYGAHLSRRNNWGATPLVLAALHGTVASAEVLLTHGASVHDRVNGGRTALMLAAEQGDAEMVDLLIRHGSDVNARDDEDLPVLFYPSFYYDPGWNRPVEAPDDSAERRARISELLERAGAVDD